MKIVYISSSKIPSRTANSIQVMKMCNAFAKNGHEVILLAPNRRRIEQGVEDIYEYYGVEPIFKIKKLPKYIKRGAGYFYDMLAAIHAKVNNPDIVYGRNINGCYYSLKLGMSVIYEAHHPLYDFNKRKIEIINQMPVFMNFKNLIVISNALKRQYLRDNDKFQNRIIVAHDAADYDENNKKIIKLNNDYFHVGYIGHLYRRRGVEKVFKLARKMDWAYFHIIGGNENDIAYWKTKIIGYNNIKLYGFVKPGDIVKYKLSFDALIAPYPSKIVDKNAKNTVNWMSPLKLFEYMASGKPIITSDLPVIREILTHMENAILCDPDNLESWIIAIKRLRENNLLRSRLGCNAKKLFLNEYTWEKRANKCII